MLKLFWPFSFVLKISTFKVRKVNGTKTRLKHEYGVFFSHLPLLGGSKFELICITMAVTSSCPGRDFRACVGSALSARLAVLKR